MVWSISGLYRGFGGCQVEILEFYEFGVHIEGLENLISNLGYSTMIKHFTQEEYDNAKFNDLLSLECYRCHKIFGKAKHRITRAYKEFRGKNNTSINCKYCSESCRKEERSKNTYFGPCFNCGKHISRNYAELKKSKNKKSKNR